MSAGRMGGPRASEPRRRRREQGIVIAPEYGEVSPRRQAEIIKNLNRPDGQDIDAHAALKTLESVVRRSTSGTAY